MNEPSALRVTAAEIARLAGVTRATVSNWRRRHPDFPAPTGGTDSSPAYDLGAVQAWLATRTPSPGAAPLTELRTVLRAGPGSLMEATLAAALTTIQQAADVVPRDLLELPDEQLAARITGLLDQRSREPDWVPPSINLSYETRDAPTLRALLRGMEADGPAATLEVLLDQGTTSGGTYRTPAAVAGLMASLLLRSPGIPYPASVLDPACGSGTLLAAAADLGATELLGQDISDGQATLAGARLRMLTGRVNVEVRVGDSIRDDAFAGRTVDAVLCAPPYGNRDWGHDDVAYDERWTHGLPPRAEPELAWVQHCLSHLSPGRSAVLLLPPATAERASGRRIRASLVRTGALRAVIALPAGAAVPLHIGLHVWVLTRPAASGDAPPHILFVETGSLPVEAVGDVWSDFATAPAAFRPRPGTARAVPVVDLLDDAVDLSPARRVRARQGDRTPEEVAGEAHAKVTELRDGVTRLRGLLPGPERWAATGLEPRHWRTATVADLVRGTAVVLADEPREGDVLLPEVIRDGAVRAHVVEHHEGTPIDPLPAGQRLLRPDPARFDPWFLATFLSADENVAAAVSGSTVVRLDVRRLRVPLVPLAEQQRLGRTFRQLAELRRAADHAAQLADETARTLTSGVTSGALLVPDPDVSTA